MVGASKAPSAEIDATEYIVPPITRTARVSVPEEPYTVLTIAPDGSWGTATSIFIGEAITGALHDCKAMSGPKLGCGYMSMTVRAAWLLGVRCGSDNIVVADKVLANAELAALNRETELRQVYRKDLPPCVRVVTVDPDGFVVGSRQAASAKPQLEQGGVVLK
jgi:hypothetical protein